MINAFSEALKPLASRMPKPVREIEVLRVSAQLEGDDFAGALNEARKSTLAWASNRAAGHLPDEAWRYEEFEHLAGGRNSSAVRIASAKSDVWAIRAEDPDKNTPGRIWTTEIVVAAAPGNRPSVSLRLIVSTNELYPNFEPAVPGLVLQWIDKPGLVRGGRALSSAPVLIGTDHAAEDLCDYLVDPDRRLPVLVATIPDHRVVPLINAESVARAVSGIARVFVVPNEHTWKLTRRFGQFRGVFGGAVRAYMPGFDVTDDPFRHRLIIAERLIASDAQKGVESWFRRVAANISVGQMRLGRDVLEFASVRTISQQLQVEKLQSTGASDADQLASANKLIENLKLELNEKAREVDGYVEQVEEADARAVTSEQENSALLARVRHLQHALEQRGVKPVQQNPLPKDWSEFVDWVEQAYPDRIVLTPSARRMVKSAAFEDVQAAARAVRWLATEHYDRRISGGGTLRDAVVETGITNTLCGGDEYQTFWRGRGCQVDWHIKNGNTRDPTRCLRIYYFWEPDTQQTVIDHLPSHRVTDAT